MRYVMPPSRRTLHSVPFPLSPDVGNDVGVGVGVGVSSTNSSRPSTPVGHSTYLHPPPPPPPRARARRNAVSSDARRPILPQRLARVLFPSQSIDIDIDNIKVVFQSLEEFVEALPNLSTVDKRCYLLSVPSTLYDEVNTLIERQNAQ
jgi:hypothetical protein